MGIGVEMHKAFKFMPKTYLEDFLRGRLRISTLEYFKNMEGPPWIADPDEGLAKIKMDFTFKKADPDSSEHRRKLASLGTLVGNADDIQFTNSKIVRESAPTYVFCVSDEPFETVRRAMCEEAPENYRYDACVEITDMETLAGSLGSGVIDDGTRFSEAFNRYAFGKVRYEKRELDFISDTSLHVNPFLKHQRFAGQQELRLIFEPMKLLPQNVFVQFDPPAWLFRSIDVHG